jgi:hypothetical protein
LEKAAIAAAAALILPKNTTNNAQCSIIIIPYLSR